MRDALKQAKKDLAYRQNEIADIRRRANLRNAEDQMTSLTEQLAAMQKQLTDAKSEHKDLDNLRANYQKYETIRDEKQKLLEEMDAHIEKLYALMEDPDISKVKMVHDNLKELMLIRWCVNATKSPLIFYCRFFLVFSRVAAEEFRF